MKKIYFSFAAMLIVSIANAQVVISQVYGGGGNSGATYTHDFIELFNRGTAAVTLSGYTLQYASASGSFSAANTQTLPNITLQPGKYFLVQQAKGNGGSTPLPTPDLIPTEEANNVVLALAGANGKVALASNGSPVTSASDANVVDMVGYGTASMYEGSAATPALSNTTAAIRMNDGCQDNNNNATDFTAAPPTPRNSAAAAHICGTAGLSNFDAASLEIYPNPLSGNVLHIKSTSLLEKTVAIYDILGKIVASTKAVDTVNISGLTNGVYVVQISEGGKTATKKLIIR